MNKITRIKNDKYTSISNVFIRDGRLSLKAKGLLTIVMTLPDDWEFTVEGIIKIVREGKTSVYSAIDELKSSGYCKVDKNRGESGVITGWEYTFFEEPLSGFPEVDNPEVDNPEVDNPEVDNPEVDDNIYNKSINNNNNNLNTTNTTNNQNNKEKEYKEKEKFAEFVKLYKKLTHKPTRGVATEFNDFKSRHKDWRQVLPYLHFAIERETREREMAKSKKVFFPEPKMLQTYLGKQRAWELYVTVGEDIDTAKQQYTPSTDGDIRWNDYYNCYIYVGMFIEDICDGYSNEDRPDGATIMLNNGRGYIIWDKTKKEWINHTSPCDKNHV